jgi:hypothetical protein
MLPGLLERAAVEWYALPATGGGSVPRIGVSTAGSIVTWPSRARVGAPTGPCVRPSARASVSAAPRASVGAATRTGVGSASGPSVRSSTRSSVCASTRASVCTPTGPGVHSASGPSVTRPSGARIPSALCECRGYLHRRGYGDAQDPEHSHLGFPISTRNDYSKKPLVCQLKM